MIQIASFCLFNLFSAVFNELRHNFTKQVPRITKRKSNHAYISEDSLTTYSVMKRKWIGKTFEGTIRKVSWPYFSQVS